MNQNTVKIVPRYRAQAQNNHKHYIQTVSEKNPKVEVLGFYIDKETRILHRCKKCGYEWEARPYNILSGHGCPECARDIHRISKEDFIRRLEDIESCYELIDDDYQPSRATLKFRCKNCGTEAIVDKYNVLRGKGCKVCCNHNRTKTSDEYFRQFQEAVGDRFELLTPYQGCKKTVTIRKKSCGHTWDAMPSQILTAKGYCAQCTEERYQSALDSLVNDPLIEVVNRTRIHKKTLFRCKQCGNEWYALYTDIVNRGQRCGKCKNKRISESNSQSHDEFMNKVSLINPSIEILGTYTRSHNHIPVRCKICGYEWNPQACSLVQGYGCPQCGLERLRDFHTKTNDEFIAELRMVNPTIEPLEEYSGSHSRVLVRCNDCGYEWSPEATSLISGYGCPKCNFSHGEKEISVYLESHSIAYEPQKKFQDLIGKNGKQFSYDFYLPGYNLLIEYQGRQHYESVDFFGGDSAYYRQQEKDAIKREYAHSHNINLLEVRYDEDVTTVLDNFFNNLNSKSLETVIPA